ncbi:MAG: SDR family NAD(P)-dependent oxidoreductase [Actinomycetota bacterium]
MDATAFRTKYGSWALVTGAAMGIGSSFATALAGRGMNLVLVDKEADLLAEQAVQLAPHVEVRTHVVDLADPAAVDVMLDDVADLPVGLLVSNAAHAVTAPWLEIPVDEKLRHIQVNCVAVTQIVDRVSRAMAERRRGGIILMSSMAARIGSPLVATYAATKAFNLILAESLWAELRPLGVDVLAVTPGMTRTPGFESSLTPASRIPAGVRVMDPDAVARAGLDALGSGPSVVPGAGNRFASVLVQRVLPRKAAIGLMARSTRAMYPTER